MDEQWQPTGSYPEETRQGISDIQLADLDGDGQLEMLVGYLGEVGVQCASLAPERVWSNRAFDNVLSLAVLRRDPDGHCRMLVGNERPALGVLDYGGTQLADIPVSESADRHHCRRRSGQPRPIAADAGRFRKAGGLWKLAASVGNQAGGVCRRRFGLSRQRALVLSASCRRAQYPCDMLLSPATCWPASRASGC